jgi:hypothetical protein
MGSNIQFLQTFTRDIARAASALVLGSAFATTASAAAIAFKATFTVDSIYASPDYLPGTLVSPPVTGEKYYAYIKVDDSILWSDGPANAGEVLAFSSQIGSSVWNPDLPWSIVNDFAGFRGPCYGPISCTPEQYGIWGLGSEFLGFDVVNGAATGLRGGVFGAADFPYIDFLGDRFSSSSRFLVDPDLVGNGVYEEFGLQGTLALQRIPEPGSVVLFAIGVFALSAASAASVRRRQGT